MNPSMPKSVHPGNCNVSREESEKAIFCESGCEGGACTCGSIYIDPEPPARPVDFTIVWHNPVFYTLSAGLKPRWLARRVRQGTLLEIGCDDGSFLDAAQKLGIEVEGVEVSPARAAASCWASHSRMCCSR